MCVRRSLQPRKELALTQSNCLLVPPGMWGAMHEPARIPVSVVYTHVQLTHKGYKSQDQSLKISPAAFTRATCSALYSNLLWEAQAVGYLCSFVSVKSPHCCAKTFMCCCSVSYAIPISSSKLACSIHGRVYTLMQLNSSKTKKLKVGQCNNQAPRHNRSAQDTYYVACKFEPGITSVTLTNRVIIFGMQALSAQHHHQ